jgi:hypothetical protein
MPSRRENMQPIERKERNGTFFSHYFPPSYQTNDAWAPCVPLTFKRRYLS